jgi:hypothetical protein
MGSQEEQGDPQKPEWERYEEVATFLLNRFAQEFGLKFVEGKQKIQGLRSGTTWEIDAKGVAEGDEGFFIVEFRRYTTSKQNQGKVGTLAYSIINTGAVGGIIVSPLGLQEGAAKIASAENIISIQLHENSTATDFAMKFLHRIMMGLTMRVSAGLSLTANVLRRCDKCGQPFIVVENATLCDDCKNL